VDQPVEYVEVARAESERGELVLRERRQPGATPVTELRANGVFVMDNAEFTSEEALASAALALVTRPREVLVGGLGLGFTAHRVLADLRVERCTVVEIEEALVGWMRDGTVPHGPSVLADARARIVVADVRAALAEAAAASYDLVLLDVDNGPGYLVHEDNSALYRAPFLTDVRRVLRPGGALAVWSMDEAPELQQVLGEVFDEAEALPHPVRLQDRDEDYWLLVGRKASAYGTDRAG
jgi:spermidine synthase